MSSRSASRPPDAGAELALHSCHESFHGKTSLTAGKAPWKIQRAQIGPGGGRRMEALRLAQKPNLRNTPASCDRSRPFREFADRQLGAES